MAHLNLVNIHPWADGNGRTSRALSTLVFARDRVVPPEFSSIEEWLGRGQNTYGLLPGAPARRWVWSPERDTHPWIRFCLEAHQQQAQRRTDLLARAWLHIEEAVAGTGLDERVVHALLPAFWGSQVRRSVYQKGADLSDQQAIRDLRELVRLERLTAHSQGRSRHHYGPGRLLAEAPEVVHRSTEPYADPYAR